MTVPTPARGVHPRASMLVLVAAGGTVGTAAREAVALTVHDGLPVAILLINLVGAFALGLLLEALLRLGPDVGWRRSVRLAIGTGFCGGFTTYSTLAVGTAELLRSGTTGLALAFAIGSVLLGALASWGGVVVGSRGARR